MSPEEAEATVTEAMNAIMAKDSIGIEAQRKEAEYEELAKIHVATLSDWTIQLAWIVSDKRWDKADNALIAANHALQKLSGAVSKLMLVQGPVPKLELTKP